MNIKFSYLALTDNKRWLLNEDRLCQKYSVSKRPSDEHFHNYSLILQRQVSAFGVDLLCFDAKSNFSHYSESTGPPRRGDYLTTEKKKSNYFLQARAHPIPYRLYRIKICVYVQVYNQLILIYKK